MTTLDKLRALHREVCGSWRRQTEPAISEGEAEVLNLGFLMLEKIVQERLEIGQDKFIETCEMSDSITKYVTSVHSQFDSDADIKITEVPNG